MSVNIKNFGDADLKLKQRLSKEKAFAASLERAVDMSRVNVPVMTKWVSERLTEVLGFEDDVVVGLVTNLLTQTTDAFSGHAKKLDPKALQVQLTGFLAKGAAPFVAELWGLLLDAQDAPHGIPRAFLERKKQELAANRHRPRGAVRTTGAATTLPADGDDDAREARQRRMVVSETRRRSPSSDQPSSSRRRRRREESPPDERRRRRSKQRDDEDDAEKRRKRDEEDDEAERRKQRRREERPSKFSGNEDEKKREKIVVRHLLVKHAASRRPSSWREAKIELPKEAARRELGELRRRVVAAEDPPAELALIARERSDCVSATKGGLLKPFARGELDRAFEAAAFSLRPGALSDVVDTPSGLHLLYRET